MSTLDEFKNCKQQQKFLFSFYNNPNGKHCIHVAQNLVEKSHVVKVQQNEQSTSLIDLDGIKRNPQKYSTLLYVQRTKSENDVSALFPSARSIKSFLPTTARSENCIKNLTTNDYQKSLRKLHIINIESSYIGETNEVVSEVNLHQSLADSSSTPTCMSSSSSNEPSPLLCSTGSISTINTNTMESNNRGMRVPIIGYEVMEERARFTVYKLRVENPLNDECWLVLRRYTDFVRLNTKLKQAFPQITLVLPRKKIFGDNFNAEFLDNRVQGLQMFINSIIYNEELRKSKIVREFFCLDEAPTYSESMEECRAIFEAQEETIAHLKLQIHNKNEVILKLQQKLNEQITEKSILQQSLNELSSLNNRQASLHKNSTSPS